MCFELVQSIHPICYRKYSPGTLWLVFSQCICNTGAFSSEVAFLTAPPERAGALWRQGHIKVLERY